MISYVEQKNDCTVPTVPRADPSHPPRALRRIGHNASETTSTSDALWPSPQRSTPASNSPPRQRLDVPHCVDVYHVTRWFC